MLNNQDWTIEQVAIEVGFISNSHFGRLFTEKEEISPAEWRKRNKNSA